MTKILKMENLECAHCASKMEKKIAAIDGVKSVSISFMAQKMILECDEARYDEVLGKIKEAVRSVEKDCIVK